MTVYIDSFFFINFLFDFLVLIASARLMGARIFIKRLLLSSLLGTFLSCAALFLPIMSGLLAKIVVVSLMSLAAYGYGSAKIFSKQTVILLVSFFILGGASGILSFFGAGYFYNGIYHINIPLLPVLSAVFAAVMAVFLISEKIKSEKSKNFAQIEIYKDGNKFMLNALFDSGNICTDCFTSLPVIAAEDVFCGIKVRESSFNTASGKGTMGIFYPDYVKVKFNGEVYEGRDVAVGIIDKNLSAEGKFNALIGGICFERLVRKADSSSCKAEGRGRNILHRCSRAASAAIEHRRGGEASTGIEKR